MRRVGAPSPALSAVVIVALVLGLLLRLYALGRGPMNSDEAVVGLMAREILHGHFFAFYWGQNYGGPEAYAVAVVFAVFGSSSFTLGLTAVLLCAGSLVLLWRIGNRMFASPVGAVAAIAFWVWPETYMTSSTVEDGFRWLALLCGLTVLLTVLRIGDGEATTRRLDRARARRRDRLVVHPGDRLFSRPGRGVPRGLHRREAGEGAPRLGACSAWRRRSSARSRGGGTTSARTSTPSPGRCSLRHPAQAVPSGGTSAFSTGMWSRSCSGSASA